MKQKRIEINHYLFLKYIHKKFLSTKKIERIHILNSNHFTFFEIMEIIGYIELLGQVKS